MDPIYAFVFLGLLFAIGGTIFIFWNFVVHKSADKRLKRMVIADRVNSGETFSALDRLANSFKEILTPLARYSAPGGAWETSPLRLKLLAAGYRKPSAPLVYFGAKTLLTLLIPAIFLIVASIAGLHRNPREMMAIILLLAIIGYFLPGYILSHLVTRRHRELFDNFPDALDLMRICVEAGLGLDVAISRVGDEMRIRSKALSDEFNLVGLEQRAGSSRQMALQNLSMRVGLPDIDSLVSTLIQAERFGTSIGESLRVHSENLRLTRKLRAEEMANKIPVKMLLPLTLCIFPLLFFMILGPVIVQIRRLMTGH